MNFLTEQEKLKNILLLDNILNNEKRYLNPITDKINRRSNYNSNLYKFNLLIRDMLLPYSNAFLTSNQTNILTNKIYEYVDKKTKFYIYEYDSFLPNAYTIPGNIFKEHPKLSILSSFNPVTIILTFISFILKNTNSYDNFNPNIYSKPIDLNISDITIFYSNSLIRRTKLNDKELLAIIFHEIGHNMIKKSHSSLMFVTFIIFIISKLWPDFNPNVIEELPQTSLSKEILFILLISLGIMLIFRYFRRSIEYDSDKFAARMGFTKELQTALQKLHNVYAYGSDIDTRIERTLNFIPRHIYKLINFLANLNILDYPSTKNRINNIDNIKKIETYILYENTLENIYDKLLTKLINILSILKKSDPELYKK